MKKEKSLYKHTEHKSTGGYRLMWKKGRFCLEREFLHDKGHVHLVVPLNWNWQSHRRPHEGPGSGGLAGWPRPNHTVGGAVIYFPFYSSFLPPCLSQSRPLCSVSTTGRRRNILQLRIRMYVFCSVNIILRMLSTQKASLHPLSGCFICQKFSWAWLARFAAEHHMCYMSFFSTLLASPTMQMYSLSSLHGAGPSPCSMPPWPLLAPVPCHFAQIYATASR